MSRREIVRSGKVVSVTASEEAEPRVEAFCATLGAGGLLARGKADRPDPCGDDRERQTHEL